MNRTTADQRDTLINVAGTPSDIIDLVINNARPHLVSYLTDLDIDRRVLSEIHAPFLHFARPYGSFLTVMAPAEHPCYPPKGERVPYLFGSADRDGILRGLKDSNDHYCSYDGDRPRSIFIQYYDGKHLRQVTREKAKNILDAYVHRIQFQWSCTTL